MNIFKMTTSQKDTVISKEIIIALRKKGGSDTKRAIVEYFRKNSEVITEEYIDFRRISEKSNKEYSRLLTNRSTACFLTEIKSLKWYNISIQRRF